MKMTNETPVMFEDKMKAIEKRKDILENAMSIIDAKFVTLRHDIMELIVTHHNEVLESEIAEYFKSKGWLSPADQRPFCMESAKELGYSPKSTYYLVKKDGWPNQHPSCWEITTGSHGFFPLDDEFGFPDQPECARLDAMGVKRYEQEGSE